MPVAEHTQEHKERTLQTLREERQVLARLLTEAICARNDALRHGAAADQVESRERMVSLLLVRTAQIDTRIVCARLRLERERIARV